MESGTISGIEYPVFDNLDEYQEYHMEKSGAVPIVQQDWRKAKKGDWAWSDDPDIKESHLDYRRIVQLLHQKDVVRKLPDGRTTGTCRTIVGTFVQNPVYKMDTDLTLREYPSGRYLLSYKSKQLNIKDRVIQRTELSRNEILFCLRVSTGCNPIEIYKEIYKSQNSKTTRHRTILLLKQERIMDKITEDVRKIAIGLDIDHKKILQNYLELFKGSKNEDFKYKVNEKLGDIIGTHGETQRVKTTFGAGAIFQGFSPKQIEEAETTQLPSDDKDEDES